MGSGPPAPESKSRFRIVFMGTPQLAAHILKRLLDAVDSTGRVVAVVTRPDQPRGRGLRLQPSEVAAVAAGYGVPTLKPVKIRTGEFLEQLKSFQPDLIVVAAYGRILPAAVLAAARLMPINVHASLLPRHRGAAPIQGAILAGDEAGGVTIMRMVERMDAGPILLQREIAMAPDETQETLQYKLAELGAQRLIEALEMLARGELHETPQDETQATYTTLVKKEDARIDWNLPAIRIERMVRAYDPWPVAFTELGGDEVRIHRAAVEDGSPGGAADPPGTIVEAKKALVVQCGEGRLRLLEVQAAGRKRMKGDEFARGRRLAVGDRLGSPAANQRA
jgi:methionyl-tRNA formyltransferase